MSNIVNVYLYSCANPEGAAKYIRQVYSGLEYGRVYLPLFKVADTPFHIQGDDMYVLTVPAF